MVKAFLKVLIISLLLFTLTLTSCTGGKTPNINNSKEENSSDYLAEISSEMVDTEDPDIISSSASSDEVSITDENSIKEFPKINEENISGARIKVYAGPGPYINNLGKVNAQKLARFINDSKVEPIDVSKDNSGKPLGSLMDIVFTQADNTTINLCISDTIRISNPIKGEFSLPSSSIQDFIKFALGIELYSQSDKIINKTVSVIPELQNRLALSLEGFDVTDSTPTFPQISTENLSSVTIFTRAREEKYKRVVLPEDEVERILKYINTKCKFIPTNLTKEDFNYDYGDYFRIVFEYKDGSKIQIAFDGLYCTDISYGYFKCYGLDTFLDRHSYITLYPYK